ncbi:MAG TPA: CARDB domain-containing protein [Methylomirabilota bacterium]|nr:CARDB domain-containing protein [Methylomirabilota bacterium]
MRASRLEPPRRGAVVFLLGLLALLGTGLPAPSPVDAAPSFAVTAASVSPSPVAPGATATITIAVKNSGTAASGINVDIEVYDASNRLVFQSLADGQSFGTGESRTYQPAWAVPSNEPTGVHTVKVGVFNASWALLVWNNSATTVPVQSGPALPVDFSVGTISASPFRINRGGTVTISAPVTNTGQGTASAILVMLFLRDPLGNEFQGNQQVVTNQSFAPGQTRTYSFQWTAPSSAVQGTYSAAIGVFSGDWSTLYDWRQDGAFAVGSTAQPTFAVGTTSVSPTAVARGQSFTVTTHITNTSQVSASNIIVLGEYNDDVGCQCNIGSQPVEGLTFSPGQTRSVSFTFTVPADLPPGRYTIDVGVFNGDWSTMYAWGYEVAALDVR